MVYATANQEKGQRTPYQALDSMDDAWSFRELKAFVRESKALQRRKKNIFLRKRIFQNLMFERNLLNETL